jgi:hypothetical protein
MSAQRFSDWLLTAPPWSRTSYHVGELAKECDAAKEGAEILKLRALVYNAALAGKCALFQRPAYTLSSNARAYDYLALKLPIRARTRDVLRSTDTLARKRN